MPDIDRPPQKTSHRRKQAEKVLREKTAQLPPVNASLSPAETQKILHELQVHQLELELQNDELRRAQTELDAERERYFHLFELAPVGYCIISQKGLIDKINLTAASLLGVSRSALPKQLLSRFIVKEDQSIYYMHQKQLLETAEPQAYELRMIKEGRTLWWAHMDAALTQNEDGSPACRITISNVTSQKQAEERLRESEFRFQSISRLTSDFAYSCVHNDAGQYRIDWITDAFYRLSGYTESELKVQGCWLFIAHPDDQEAATEPLRRLKTGETDTRGFRIVTKGGQVRFFNNYIECRADPQKPEILRLFGAVRDITGRKRDEREKDRLRLNHETILATVAEGILSLDLQGNHTFVNSAAARILGWKAEELIGRNSHSAWHHTRPDGSPYPVEQCGIVDSSVNGKMQSKSTDFFWRKDGTGFPVEYTSTPIVENGQVAGSVITFSDITQRVLVEKQEKLRVRENQAFIGLRELADRTDIDLDQLLQEFVDRLPASWQYPEITYARLVIGDREFHTENYRDSPWKQSAPVKIQGLPDGKLEVGYLEERPDQGDGPFFKETRFLLTRLAERLGLVIGRKQSDLMLRGSEEKYRILVETTNTGFLIMDKEGRVTDANQEYIRLTGHSELSDILGRSINEWTADYEKQKNAMAVNQCIKVGFIRDFVIDYVDGNGRITPIEMNATVIGSGESLHIVSLCRNVTQRKQAEEKLERLYQKEKHLRQELQDEAKARGMFIDILAHELRTPLTPITVCSAMLQEMVSSHDLGIEKKLVENMFNGTQALARRIEELLDLGNFSRGTFTLRKQPVNVTDLVSKTAARFKPLAEQQSRQFILEIQDGLPVIEADPARLEQVLANLLSNAVKYSPQKSTITLKAGKTDSHIVIEVHDEGKGITSEEQKKLFDPYHRVMQDTQKLPGIGLGLAICKQIVEAHGGKISIENQINQGNCFKVELPNKVGIEGTDEAASG